MTATEAVPVSTVPAEDGTQVPDNAKLVALREFVSGQSPDAMVFSLPELIAFLGEELSEEDRRVLEELCQ